ncbi:chemotaxis protein CheR, partial [Caulobacter sp. CCUG 60055]|uniref:CheR family methyltransferase n=1 Tax=Caulobacter sp. CCUG 60055 TaxID=2100090 RepID=UPI001FA7FB1F
MRPEDIQVLRQLVEARSGVQVDPGKLYLIESRLAPVARREGFASIPEMIQAVRVHRDDRLMWAATDAMSVTETAFFRDRAVFELFRDEMLPALAQSRAGAPIRVWSAACSTGQEAYSLAMMVDEVRPRLPGARVDLFGSDLSERCLEKAQSGLYTQFEVQRGLPIRLLVRHFERAEDNWALSPRVRQMVRWRRVNLLADLKPLGRFEVIFCRNAVCWCGRP